MDIFLYPGQTHPADLVLSDPTALRSASGDAVASPLGVSMVASVGTVTAIGEVTTRAAGGGPLFYQNQWPALPKRARIRIAGVAARMAVGQVVASGGATAQPLGVSMTARVGSVTAHGVQNLDDELMAWLLLEAA